MKWPAPKALSGMITIELVVAMGILASVMLPVAYSLVQEQRAARAYYWRAVAMEIVDGEMESLAAGEWRAFPLGTQPYTVRAESGRNLPPGDFTLSLRTNELRLEWRPRKRGQGGAVWRTVSLNPEAKP